MVLGKNIYNYVAVLCPGYLIRPKPSQDISLLEIERYAFSITNAWKEGRALHCASSRSVQMFSAALAYLFPFRAFAPLLPRNNSVSRNAECISWVCFFLFPVDFLLAGSAGLLYKCVGVQHKRRLIGCEHTPCASHMTSRRP